MEKKEICYEMTEVQQRMKSLGPVLKACLNEENFLGCMIKELKKIKDDN
ncbi:MAG: hypothetical protein MUO82_07725 [Candidatus Thermoplasmatota archaeon]|nr:hypothetical protein [Candidatus Thermoplasmatota archaeon]